MFQYLKQLCFFYLISVIFCDIILEVFAKVIESPTPNAHVRLFDSDAGYDSGQRFVIGHKVIKYSWR